MMSGQYSEVSSVASSSSTSSSSRRDVTLVRKPGTRSVVWDYFGLEVDECGKLREETASFPLCRTCGKKISAKGGNTTNLLAHLRDNHPTLYVQAERKVARKKPIHDSSEDEQQQVQLTLAETLERSKMFSPDSSAAREINHAVTYFIAKEMQPLSIVDKPGFRHMVRKLNPRY